MACCLKFRSRFRSCVHVSIILPSPFFVVTLILRHCGIVKNTALNRFNATNLTHWALNDHFFHAPKRRQLVWQYSGMKYFTQQKSVHLAHKNTFDNWSLFLTRRRSFFVRKKVLFFPHLSISMTLLTSVSDIAQYVTNAERVKFHAPSWSRDVSRARLFGSGRAQKAGFFFS